MKYQNVADATQRTMFKYIEFIFALRLLLYLVDNESQNTQDLCFPEKLSGFPEIIVMQQRSIVGSGCTCAVLERLPLCPLKRK